MKIKSIKFFKIIAIALCFFMVFEQSGFAQIAGELDLASHFLALRNSFIQDRFRPLHLRCLSYDPSVNNFNLLLDKGDFVKGLSSKGTDPKASLQQETKTLLNYFFIGISLPNEAFWVNLRPDAEDNIIDSELGETDVGKILLEADLQLKKDTANFTSPQTPEGKDYWDKLYKKAEELYGNENITIPTLTRPWIVPDEIIIRESSDNAYIYKATLKVMLEQDYLKDSSTYNFKDQRSKALNEYSSQLIRETIIPKLTKEINSSKRYAPLRQVYYSLILAQWFKHKFYGKSGLYSYLIDRHNLTGLTSKTSWSKTTYFNAYKTSFQQGEYNIKEPVYTPTGQTIRSYMSGGVALQNTIASSAVVPGSIKRDMFNRDLLDLSQNKIISTSAQGGTVSSPFDDIKILQKKDLSVSTESTVSATVLNLIPEQLIQGMDTIDTNKGILDFKKELESRFAGEGINFDEFFKLYAKNMIGISDYLKKLPKLQSHYCLGLHDRKIGLFDALVNEFDLKTYLDAYEELKIPLKGDDSDPVNTEALVEKLVSQQAPVVFFVPRGIFSYWENTRDKQSDNDKGVTKTEMELLVAKFKDNKDALRNVVFVFELYETISYDDYDKYLKGFQFGEPNDSQIIGGIFRLYAQRNASAGLKGFSASLNQGLSANSPTYQSGSPVAVKETGSLTAAHLKSLALSVKESVKIDEDIDYISLAITRICDVFLKVLNRNPEDEEIIKVFKLIESDPDRIYLDEATYSKVAEAYANEIKRADKANNMSNLNLSPVAGSPAGAGAASSLETDKGFALELPLDDKVGNEIVKDALSRYPNIKQTTAIFSGSESLEEEKKVISILRSIRDTINNRKELTDEQLGVLKAIWVNFTGATTALFKYRILPEKSLARFARLIDNLEKQCWIELIGRDPKAFQMYKALQDRDCLALSQIMEPGLFDRLKQIDQKLKIDEREEKEIFEIGGRENLLAHGVSSEKKGLRSLINIILEGEISANIGEGYAGQLIHGDSGIFAGSHGPYYVVLKKGLNGRLTSHDEFQWYLMPNKEIKQEVTRVLELAYTQGRMKESLLKSELPKLITYREFIDAYNKKNAIGFPVTPESAGSPAGGKISSSLAAGTKEDTIEFHYEKEYFIQQVGGAVVNLVKYLKAENFAAVIISGDSALLILEFLKEAWKKLYPQAPFPPVFTFQGRRLYTDPNIINSEVDGMESLPQEDGASVMFRDVKDKRICFVDDFRQSGTKYRGVSRNLSALGVKSAGFAFIVASEKAKNQEYFSGAVDSWLPIDIDRLTWQQRKKKATPGLEAQNRWDGILNFIQDSTYTEEAHGDAAGSPVAADKSVSSPSVPIVKYDKIFVNQRIKQADEALRRNDVERAILVYESILLYRQYDPAIYGLGSRVSDKIVELYNNDELDADLLLMRPDIKLGAGRIIKIGITEGRESGEGYNANLSAPVAVAVSGSYGHTYPVLQTGTGRGTPSYQDIPLLLNHWHPCDDEGGRFDVLSGPDINNTAHRWVMVVWGTENDGFYALLYDKKTNKKRYYLLTEDGRFGLFGEGRKDIKYKFNPIDYSAYQDGVRKVVLNSKEIAQDMSSRRLKYNSQETLREYKGKSIQEIEFEIKRLWYELEIKLYSPKDGRSVVLKGMRGLIDNHDNAAGSQDVYFRGEARRQAAIIIGKLDGLLQARKTILERGEQTTWSTLYVRNREMIDYLLKVINGYSLNPQKYEPAKNNRDDATNGTGQVSSPATDNSVSLASDKNLGGIDMRSLPQHTVIQSTASSSSLNQGLVPKTAPLTVSDKEWQEIERVANSGIAPSCERLREYLLSLQDPNSQTDKVLACIADILRQEEEKACGTESSLREILVLLESDKPVNELRLALAKVQVFAKEPQLIAQ